MDKSQIVEKALIDHKELPTRTLSKLLHDQHPEIWKTKESARGMIKDRLGINGPSRSATRKNVIPELKVEPSKEALLKKISDNYSSEELKAIANGGRIVPGYAKVPVINFNGTHFRWGAFGDTHIGSSYASPGRIDQAIQEFEKEKVDFVCHTGDVTEGMSNRPGHIYELSHLGYHEQRAEAVRQLSQWKGKMYLIDGNHDRWYIKSNGALIVKDIADRLPDAEFLGHDEGDISLNSKAILKLWHGEDGNSYALSYRIQKVIESLSGGEKPSIMLFGHTHKSIYVFERNVHCFSTGSMQAQSSWMRGKRIAAHVGFWIIDAWVNSQGVSKVQGCFYPFYT